MTPLLTPHDLAEKLRSGAVRLLDASYGPDAEATWAHARIGDAHFFDVDAIADTTAPYPHTLPDAELFGRSVGALGVGNDDTVVIYDQTGLSFAAARAWWMFRTFGHEAVYVLDGGLPAWVRAGFPLAGGAPQAPTSKNFTARFRPELYRSLDEMTEGRDTVLDARAAPRFTATVHTPDGTPVPAHIPHSHNLPYQSLLDGNGALKPRPELESILRDHANAPRLVATCGSGVTACVLALAFHVTGREDVAVYDGSWTEWSHRHALT